MKFSTSSVFFICFLLVNACVFQNPQRRAQKQMEKQKYEKAENLLQKSLAKDSLNPVANFLLSQLYLDTAYQQHIDTAQYFIQEAISELPEADKKDLKRLRKIGADSLSLLEQLARVDSAAFRRATEAHSIEAYDYFLNNFPEAAQIPEATRRRNALAYRAAEEENTYQSYQRFFQTYPEAAEAPEARERYEELLFIANTQTGTLDAYIRFLAEYPETPYRSRLLRNIYHLSTAAHQAEQYAGFIRQYPQNPFTREAVNQLYHLFKEQADPATFLQRYPQIPYRDSLRQVIALEKPAVFTFLKQGKWGFMNEYGEEILPTSFDDVHPDYLCETIETDYIETIREYQPVVVARNGHLIVQEDYEKLEDLGHGLLRIQQNQQQGLLLKSGKQLLPAAYDQIKTLGDNLLQVTEYGRQGILTHNGQWLAEPTYDSLARIEDYVLLFRNNKMAVITVDSLISSMQNNQPLSLGFRYQQAVLADSIHLLAYLPDGRQSLLNRKLKTVIPPTQGSIRAYEGGWLLEKDQRYEVLGPQGENILNATFRQVKIREPWIAYKTDSLWGMYHTKLKQASFDIYDSLTLLHANIMVVHNGREKSALFVEQDTVAQDLSGTDDYRLLRPLTRTQSRQAEQVYLLVTDGNAKKIYNRQGRLILQGRYSEVSAPDNQLLLLKSSRGTAVADTSGQILLKPEYDAVGNYQNGYFATLDRSRFGVFNPYKNLHIKPQYQVALRPYGDSLLLANKNRQWGIIDHSNKTVIPFEYDQLQFFSDSVILAQQDEEWQLINLRNRETIYGPFEEYKIIQQTLEESLMIVYTENGYGVYSSLKGELIAPSYDDIINLGTNENPLLYCEKEVKEADMYVVVYVNKAGETLYKEAYPREDWLRLLCE